MATINDQAYCSIKCKADEDGVRKVEEAFTKVLEGVSIATDVDADLLRMMVRLAVSRALALGLHPKTAAEAGARREDDEELEPEAEPTQTSEVWRCGWKLRSSLAHDNLWH